MDAEKSGNSGKQEYSGFFDIGRKFSDLLLILISGFYLFGFISWNFYLANFGFFESNLLQTRYISAGILFLVIVWIPLYVFRSIIEKIFLLSLKNKISRTIYYILLISCLVLFLVFYLTSNFSAKFFNPLSYSKGIFEFYLLELFLILSVQRRTNIRLKWPNPPQIIAGLLFLNLVVFNTQIFPYLPGYLGGAQPISTNIIGQPDSITYLSNFNIYMGENGKGLPSVETTPLCKIYENNDYIIVGITNKNNQGALVPVRILILKKDLIEGFSTKPDYFKYFSCPQFISPIIPMFPTTKTNPSN